MRQFRVLLASLIVGWMVLAQSASAATGADKNGPNGPNGPYPADMTAQPAGTIDLVAGEVQILPAGKAPRRAAVGNVLNEGDVLVTGKSSEVHVTMADSGFLALRPNTRMQIVTFKADGGDEDNSVFKLVEGGMRSITGWIGKYNRKSYKVQTPTASIGIRGTDHETRYIPPGSPDGPPGTYDKVFYGETTIETSAGQTEVSPDRAGFVGSDSGQTPRVLASIPTFFQPGPNEALINTKHAEIQKIIEQRRDERRKVVQQLRAAFNEAAAQFRAQRDTNKSADQQRLAQADAQHQALEQRRVALHARYDALEDQRKAITDLRTQIARETAPEIGRNRELVAQMRALRARSLAVRDGYEELKAGRKALADRNIAAAEARKTVTDAHRKNAEDQLASFSAMYSDLQQRQKTLEDMRQAIRDGYARNPEGNADLRAQRRAADEVADKVGKQQLEYQTGMNALFDDNVGFFEKNVDAGKAQSLTSEQQIAAFDEREERLMQEQAAIDDAREAIQESSVADPAKKARVHDLILTARTTAQALREERKKIQADWKVLHAEEFSGAGERQRVSTDEIKAIREKHQDYKDKLADLQSESAAMQKEIRALYEQEQRRYLEELKAARQQQAQQQASPDSPPDAN